MQYRGQSLHALTKIYTTETNDNPTLLKSNIKKITKSHQFNHKRKI